MKLEMISTGEEVLAGQIVDTNAAWFADTMMAQGIELQRRSTVGDRLDDLMRLFSERSQQADLILVNGGLGPTSDDLCAEAIAGALGEKLIEDRDWRRHLEAMYRKSGRPFPAANLKQCLLPESALRVDNTEGTAPGFRVRLNRAWLFFTPGVPVEFKAMVQQQFLPFLQEHFPVGQSTRLHKLLTLGHGESALAGQLQDIDIPPGITLGYRPSPPIVEIKLFARGDSAIRELEGFSATVKARLGNAVVAENCPSIAERVHQLLLEQQSTLSIAESCTGGMLTSQLVEFAGSSAYLQHGLVSYANQSKQDILGIDPALLARHGAVSLETAAAMAMRVRELGNSEYGLATTGIAGPDGGTPEKPVGTVCLALADRNGCQAQSILLSQRSRNLVRIMSCAVALDMLRRSLLQEDVVVPYSFIPCKGSLSIPAPEKN